MYNVAGQAAAMHPQLAVAGGGRIGVEAAEVALQVGVGVKVSSGPDRCLS